MLLVDIKVFNELTDKKTFFDESSWNKQEAYEKLVKMSRNNDDITWLLLDYSKSLRKGSKNFLLLFIIKVTTETYLFAVTYLVTTVAYLVWCYLFEMLHCLSYDHFLKKCIFWTWQIKLYLTVNQSQVVISPKIIQIF